MSNDSPILFDAAGVAHTDEAAGLSFTFTPLYDRMLVRVIPQQERTYNGLVLPAYAHQDTPHIRAEVIAVGHGRVTPNGDTVPLVVKAGDLITFFRVKTEQVVMPSAPGTELMIIRELHVLGVYSDLPRASGVLAPDGREVVSS